MESVSKEILTPLMTTCYSDKIDTIKLSIDNGENIEEKDIFDRTPLILAASKNNLDIVELLLLKGENKKTVDINNHTFLDYSIGKQSVEKIITVENYYFQNEINYII